MHASNAICINDLCDDREERPHYYCENPTCGVEFHHPSASGLCWPCEVERGEKGEDDREH